MIALFTGGSGSGKSEMAESFACRRAEGRKLYYFATMRVSRENDLVVVTNEIFSDGAQYDAETAKYIENLGVLNQELARRAQIFAESVYSLPVVHKGALE